MGVKSALHMCTAALPSQDPIYHSHGPCGQYKQFFRVILILLVGVTVASRLNLLPNVAPL